METRIPLVRNPPRESLDQRELCFSSQSVASASAQPLLVRAGALKPLSEPGAGFLQPLLGTLHREEMQS